MPHGLAGTALLATCLAAGLPLAAGAQNQYVTAVDLQVAQDANRAAIEFCAGDLSRFDPVAGREDLLAALGGNNIFLQAATNATDGTEFMDNLTEDDGAVWVLSNFVPTTVALVVGLSFLLCCWTFCPCRYMCRCLRCCARERKTHLCYKIFAFLAVLVVGCGIIASVALASRGHSAAVDGVSNAGCTSALMLNTTLQGKQDNPTFIGMLPALDSLNELERTLDNNSAFMTGLSSILDRTFDVSESVTLASETFRLLQSMMELDANKNPKDAAGNSMMHTCDFCDQIAAPLGSAATALEEGAGSAMSGARAEVDAQLTPDARQRLQGQLSSGIGQMAQLKDQFRDAFKVFVEPGAYDNFKKLMQNQVRAGVLVLFLEAFMLVGCGCLSVSCFTFREKASRPLGNNPYSRSTHRCACCAWWFGFLYAIVALLIGGLIMGASVPMSGACLIMDDLSPEMVTDLAPLMNLNLTGDEGVMLLDMVGSCINPSNVSASHQNLLQITFQRNSTTGQKTTLYDSIVTMVSDPINQQFDAMASSFSTSGLSLGSSPAIVSLRDLFRLNPIDSLLVADQAAMMEDPLLAPLAQDDRGDSGLAVGFGTSAACQDHLVQGNFGSLSGRTIPGVDDFVARLSSRYGTVSGTCAAARSTCTSADAVIPPGTSVCAAANAYLTKKEQLMTVVATFRCDLFEDPANPAAYCDPKDMSQVGGNWINTCQKADGTLTVKEKLCTLAEFETYVQGFDVRIQRAMQRLDAVVQAKSAVVNVELRDHVNQGIVGPIVRVADGITCGWLPANYQSMVNGLCFQGVWGLRKIGQAYVLSGAFILVLVVAMYAVWRRAVDNVNHWKPEPADCPVIV